MAKERHPLRFLFKFAVITAIVGFLGKFVAQKKQEYYGMPESQARAKLHDKLASRMGEEQASQVVDQIIAKLSEKGVITPDAAPSEEE
ncbi:MAG TPA: hypothetical protein EYP73_04890 [Acidimicrobiia bacterium]|nr:hypothetical protein [Acidimicrobiia bacterium]